MVSSFPYPHYITVVVFSHQVFFSAPCRKRAFLFNRNGLYCHCGSFCLPIHPFYAKKTDTDIRVAEFVQYMTGMRFKASWGLSALEGIVRGNEDDMKDSYIPSYIYYGVDDPKSLAMRMLGVPRSLSGSLSKVIEGNVNDYSFTRLRTILKGLNNSDWDSLCPQGSKLSGQEWKRVVDILMK